MDPGDQEGGDREGAGAGAEDEEDDQ